ncbi:ParB-like chromosome segregation protein Spo0J [Bradyrhizobium japonicum]|uniref:plasmid partitioning protein RepB C-terminal domain-containing protein n=1 Tax=Bradyrhizobium japonicum TaxID=375 RepID=UPI003394EF3B
MVGAVSLAFERETRVIPLKDMLPLKLLPAHLKRSWKYQRLAASIAEVGVIEPLVVFHKPDDQGRYILLDGHKKRMILLNRGQTEEVCLLATEKEAFTYNGCVNWIPTIHEHLMIARAAERGVPEERIARALNLKVAYIRRRRTLLRGICKKAVDLLKDHQVNPATFDALRKMKAPRQIEACTLMKAASNHTAVYATKALLAASDEAQRKQPSAPRPVNAVTCADLTLMEREMKKVQQDFSTIEATYGNDMVNLVVAAGYVLRLISNRRIARYLEDNHPEIFSGFKTIAPATSCLGCAQPIPR